MILCATLLAGTLAACGGSDGPTVDQAGAKLAKDGKALMNEDQPPMVRKKVSESADRDVSCGDGKYRREYKATADFGGAGKGSTILGIMQSAIQDDIDRLGYKYDTSTNDGSRDVKGRSKNSSVSLNVHIQEKSPMLTVSGSTGCLSES